MASLFEQYRPVRWDDVVGQDAAVKLLRGLELGGRAILLAGPSGTGKTTLARLAAQCVAEVWHIQEVDALDVGLEYVRDMERELAYRGMGALQGKVWIINEVHGLRGAIVSRLLTLIEKLPDWATVIFTTTKKPQMGLFADMEDADPFFSRCLCVPLAWHEYADSRPGPLTYAFAEKARQIAANAGLDGRPLDDYLALALGCRHNLRAMLTKIEAGCMRKGGA